MNTNTKTLASAALAGLFAAGTATAGIGSINADKGGCSGKDGCSGKKKENISRTLGGDKEGCSGKDGCSGKKKEEGDKEGCSGKDGCSGKKKESLSIL